MGDAVLGIVVSFVLSQIGILVIFAIGGYSTGDDLPLWLTAVAEIPLWIGLVGTNPIASLPIGEEGIEISSLWLASGISLVTAALIFRTV